jgi:hypothetical protein
MLSHHTYALLADFFIECALSEADTGSSPNGAGSRLKGETGSRLKGEISRQFLNGHPADWCLRSQGTNLVRKSWQARRNSHAPTAEFFCRMLIGRIDVFLFPGADGRLGDPEGRGNGTLRPLSRYEFSQVT